MSYYERWAASIAVTSMERGTIQQKDLDRHLGVSTQEPAVQYAALPCTRDCSKSIKICPLMRTALCVCRFGKGDYVKVRPENAAVRPRKPHLRTPGYLFGLVGVVERQCVGMAANPEGLAFRQVTLFLQRFVAAILLIIMLLRLACILDTA